MVPSEVLTYLNFFVLESFERNDRADLENKAATMDSVFNLIIVISMSLCFFSLSSSMSANIYDQSKEISVLRSIGVTKLTILRIFIYEALVLVISCSICGFIIGVVVGNLMMLQQSLFTSSTFEVVIPIDQLKTMVFFSFACAIASTWNAANNLLKLSIPDIQRFVK